MNETQSVSAVMAEESKRMKKLYGPDGNFKNWGEDNGTRPEVKIIPELLRESGLIKSDQPVIISPSSNTGYFEEQLKQKFPNGKIIAGDIAEVKKINPEQTPPVRLDANFLPFPDNSADCIFDLYGAAWYASQKKETKLLSRQLQEYQRVLKSGGILVVDCTEKITELPDDITTVEEIQQLGIFGEPTILEKTVDEKPYRVAIFNVQDK